MKESFYHKTPSKPPQVTQTLSDKWGNFGKLFSFVLQYYEKIFKSSREGGGTEAPWLC